MPRTEISVAGLHKTFGDHPVLSGIDLEIRRNDVIAIVGGSGSGKTVLMNHVLSQLTPDRGRIEVVNHHDPAEPLVDLHSVGELTLDDIHRHWGVVFQRNALF